MCNAFKYGRATSMSSSPSSGMCNLGNCIGYFDCLAQCGTCAANCPYGCCCVTPQNAPSNCGICPTGSQCMSVSDCQSKGGTCAANCPMGCCCSLGGTAQQPQAPPQTTQPQTTQAPTQTAGVPTSMPDIMSLVSMMMVFAMMGPLLSAFR